MRCIVSALEVLNFLLSYIIATIIWMGEWRVRWCIIVTVCYSVLFLVLATVQVVTFKGYFMHWLGFWRFTWLHCKACLLNLIIFLLFNHFSNLFWRWDIIVVLFLSIFFTSWFSLSRFWTQNRFSFAFSLFNRLSNTLCLDWNRDCTFVKLVLLFRIKNIKTFLILRRPSRN